MFVKLQDVLNILGRYSNALSDPPIDEQELIELKIVHKLYHAIKDEVLIHNVEPVRHGEWNLEVHSFYVDTWDESSELCVYILASCSNCGEEHSPKEVFSMHVYAPEDADCDYRFDKEYEEAKALEKFKQRNYKFQNYCPNCGVKMDGGKEYGNLQ